MYSDTLNWKLDQTLIHVTLVLNSEQFVDIKSEEEDEENSEQSELLSWIPFWSCLQ
jgi:hypothetical protein